MTAQVDYRTLGQIDAPIFPIALGGAAMSGTYGQAIDERESERTIREAIDCGVNLIDTADFYGSGHNEMLIGRAIRDRRDALLLSVKFGALRDPTGRIYGLDCRPESITNFLVYSLRRLGVDHIDIYRPSRLDPNVPIEDVIGAISRLVEAGYVRHIGLSEMGPETIRRAHAVHPICDLQIEYSLISRNPEQAIFPLLKALGIGLTAYGVLSHGLLAGSNPGARAGDQRAHLPRFNAENFAHNRALVGLLEKLAQDRGATSAQLATAWVMAQGAHIVPVMGARTRAQLDEILGAVDIRLDAEDLRLIEEAMPSDAIAGTRYNEAQLQMLDSEKGEG